MSWEGLDKAAGIYAFLAGIHIFGPMIYTELSVGRGLEEVQRIIDTCEKVVHDMTVSDPLLGKLVENKWPGFIEKFNSELRMVRIHHASCTRRAAELSYWKNPLQWRALRTAVKTLVDTASSLHTARVATSSRVGESPIYQTLHEDYYKKKFSEEELQAKLREYERNPPPQLQMPHIAAEFSESIGIALEVVHVPSNGPSAQSLA